MTAPGCESGSFPSCESRKLGLGELETHHRVIFTMGGRTRIYLLKPLCRYTAAAAPPVRRRLRVRMSCVKEGRTICRRTANPDGPTDADGGDEIFCRIESRSSRVGPFRVNSLHVTISLMVYVRASVCHNGAKEKQAFPFTTA